MISSSLLFYTTGLIHPVSIIGDSVWDFLALKHGAGVVRGSTGGL